jgi:hypothetical protein
MANKANREISVSGILLHHTPIREKQVHWVDGKYPKEQWKTEEIAARNFFGNPKAVYRPVFIEAMFHAMIICIQWV